MSNSSKNAIEVSGRRSDVALRHIVALIFQGQLSPGARLPAERDLAEQLGVSRSTLRDAVNRLEARGYIERRSKSGNFISTAIPKSLSEPIEDVVDANVVGFADIIEMRKVLELWAVAKAADSATTGALDAMEDCLEIMRQTAKLRSDEQLDRHSKADFKFHQIIAEMTRNPIYTHLMHFFANLVSRSVSLSSQLVSGDYGQQNVDVHQEVYEAIKAGDPLKSKRAMLAHFQFVEKHLAPKKHERSKKAANKAPKAKIKIKN